MVEFDNQGGVGQQYPGYPGAEIFNDYTNNVAAGKNAHAEGQETNATGPRAHAEGYKTTVYAADAHAEGRNTWAMGNYSHAEGLYGIAFGSSSHVEGNVETDTGVGEDSAVILNDEELIRNFLSEFTTKYLGKAVYRKLDWDKIGNYKFHCALGISSHAEGINNIVCDKAGHVEGYNNVCGDEIPGKEEDAVSYAPHAEGMNNRMASRVLASHVGGAYCTVNSGHYSFAHGYCLSVSNDYETAFGRYNLSQYNGKKVLFAYGIGSSDSGRENAFAILEDGTVVIPKMEGGNVSDIVAKLLVPVYDEINRLANKYSSLSETVKSQQAQIDSLVNLIGQYHPVGEKAYVVQEMLFFTDKIDASVQGDTLSLSDEATTVENGVLTIK